MEEHQDHTMEQSEEWEIVLQSSLENTDFRNYWHTIFGLLSFQIVCAQTGQALHILESLHLSFVP